MKDANLFIPDQSDPRTALSRTTHLAIGAHADDLEIFAFHGILQCFEKDDQWFTGVVLSDGSGSPRSGRYATVTDEQMVELRLEEQKQAARIGKYSAQVQLGYPSSEIKKARNPTLHESIKKIILSTQPKIIYTHNLADKHDTHVAVAMHVIRVVREVASYLSLEGFYGCEVWRDLDWMPDNDKKILPVSEKEDLALQLCAAHQSQIEGGKRYDHATIARRKANATFLESATVDNESAVTFAMDYLPLVKDVNLSPSDYVASYIKSFSNDILSMINKYK